MKPDKIDLLLEIWLQSAEWNAYAKSFIVDKLKSKKKAESAQSKDKEEKKVPMLGDELMLGLTEPKEDLDKKFIFTAA